MTIVWLFFGALLGGGLIAYARTRPDHGRRIFAIALSIAAVIYVGFALPDAGVYWLMTELAGVLVFSSIAWLGLQYSTHWLGVGWVLHSVWDAGLHSVGSGAAFVPNAFVVACISFDLLIAAYIVWRLRISRAAGES